MSKTKFVLDTSAVKTEILQADWMQTFIENEANLRYSGENIKTFIGFDRAKSIVYSDEELE